MPQPARKVIEMAKGIVHLLLRLRACNEKQRRLNFLVFGCVRSSSFSATAPQSRSLMIGRSAVAQARRNVGVLRLWSNLAPTPWLHPLICFLRSPVPLQTSPWGRTIHY